MVISAPDMLRRRSEHAEARVTSIELFFDLVFVFAVTQLSHLLLAHLDLVGAVETGLLLLAVWWVWIYTSWVTNWLDPGKTPVRLILFALMLAGLILSASIPKAFAERGLAFGVAYVTMQIGRSLFMLWALNGRSEANYRNFQRITAWFGFSGLFWLAGGFAPPELRLGLWTAAMLIELVSPSLGFWVPGLGRSTTADWDIEGGHMAERCGLFIIIALGESILITGATFAGLIWSSMTVAAFVAALVGSIAMWWIYFNVGSERAAHLIRTSSDPGRLARLAYTYVHVLAVAGIIVGAVGDELTLTHPDRRPDAPAIAVLLGGPALYLAGTLLFKWVTAGWPPLSHLVGLALLALLVPLAPHMTLLALGAAAALVLVLTATWETVSLRAARGLSTPAGH